MTDREIHELRVRLLSAVGHVVIHVPNGRIGPRRMTRDEYVDPIVRTTIRIRQARKR